MTRNLRLILAAFATFAALAGAPVQGQSSRAIVTFNDPNCASWGVTQSGSNFTLTCQTLLCTLTPDKPAPLPAEAVVLTGACVGLTGSAYTWSKFSGPAGCPAIASTTATANLAAPGATVNGCVYKVAATDPVNGGGSATLTLNWTTALGVSPSGCSVAFTTGSATLLAAGGPVTMVASCTPSTVNAATAWTWTKNGVSAGSGSSLSDTLPQNTLTANVTYTYAVTATNSGSPPTTTQQNVVVTGTGGGGGIDMTACTAAGFTGRGYDIGYFTSGNFRLYTNTLGSFGNYDAIVVSFTTPAADATGGASFSMIYAGGAPQVKRLMTLGSSPCMFGTGYSFIVPAATGKTQGPILNVNIAPLGGTGGVVQLLPNTKYYITFVNRNDFFGTAGYTPSCTASTCDAYIDSN